MVKTYLKLVKKKGRINFNSKVCQFFYCFIQDYQVDIQSFHALLLKLSPPMFYVRLKKQTLLNIIILYMFHKIAKLF